MAGGLLGNDRGDTKGRFEHEHRFAEHEGETLGPAICYGLPQAISAKELALKELRIFTVGGCRMFRTVQFIEGQPSHQSVFGCVPHPRLRTILISSCSLRGLPSRIAFVESQVHTCRRVATL